jgi:hypothetical protein
MKKSILLLSVFVFSIVVFVACQSNPKLDAYNDQVDEEMGMATKVGVYIWDRFMDLTDVAYVDLAFGDGFLLNAHATKWVQLGAGYRDGVCFGFLPRSFGMWYDDRTEAGAAVPPFFNLYYKKQYREALWGTTTLFDHDVDFAGADYLSNDTQHWTDIGVSLHLFPVGIDAGISPYEVFDFVFGWFGMPFLVPVDPVGVGTELDVANDDSRARWVRKDSDLPYYNYALDPQPKDRCSCGSLSCPGCD